MSPRHAHPAPRCPHCRVVVGRHEPVVLLRRGSAPEATTYARFGGSQPAGECYHGRCYARAFSQVSAA
jgi:hypothetical protein